MGRRSDRGANSGGKAGGPDRAGITGGVIFASVAALSLSWHGAFCVAGAGGSAPTGVQVVQLAPLDTHQRPPLPPVDRTIPPPVPAPAPAPPENRGAVDPRTGERYLPSGKGVVNPRTGEYYPPSGGGFINPRTGEYFPPIDRQ